MKMNLALRLLFPVAMMAGATSITSSGWDIGDGVKASALGSTVITW